MAEAIVQDWLAEYESLQPSEMQSFSSLHENNQEIAEAIYTIFNERLKYPELIHGICNQFLSFYRSKEDGLRKFPMQFIPILIYVYLNSVAMGDKKSCRSVETLLICIYNAEVTAEDGTPKVVPFRLPVLAQASIYHEEKSLPLMDLRRWEENCNREIKWGPFQQIESINAQSRMKVMSALLFCYNHQLSLTQKNTLLHLCRMASQIVNQGFSKPGHAHRTSYGSDPTSALVPRPPPRIALSSQFLVELVHAIYFAMFNGFGTIAIQTMDDIHSRGCYEMFSDVILVTSAVKNSLHANPSGQPSDGPMGLSVALTPATNTAPTVSKSMITNASFRTKKLPDDLDMEFLASLPHQPNADHYRNNIDGSNPDGLMQLDTNNDPTMAHQQQQQHGTKKGNSTGGGGDNIIINPLRWKTWGWKYSPGSKTSSIEEEPDSPKKSLSSSKNSSPNASPKIRKPQQAIMKPAAEEILNSFTNSSMVAAIRRKKSSSPAKKSPELRSSAGARLISQMEDSCDSGDEKEALLANGRPASIHIIQTASDDIPIQGDDPNLLQSQTHPPPALMSITEESNDQQPNTRNSIIRSSKEGIKAQAHKALIAGFKKSKDKDKDKEKDKDKDGKVTLHKNGSIASETKEVPKPPIRKEKHTHRSSIIQVSQDSVADFDKSPAPNMKTGKHFDSSSSLSNMTASSATTTTAEMVPMQTMLTNGNFNDSDLTSDSMDINCDASDSLHSGNSIDLSKQRPILPVISAISDQVQNSQL